MGEIPLDTVVKPANLIDSLESATKSAKIASKAASAVPSSVPTSHVVTPAYKVITPIVESAENSVASVLPITESVDEPAIPTTPVTKPIVPSSMSATTDANKLVSPITSFECSTIFTGVSAELKSIGLALPHSPVKITPELAVPDIMAMNKSVDVHPSTKVLLFPKAPDPTTNTLIISTLYEDSECSPIIDKDPVITGSPSIIPVEYTSPDRTTNDLLNSNQNYISTLFDSGSINSTSVSLSDMCLDANDITAACTVSFWETFAPVLSDTINNAASIITDAFAQTMGIMEANASNTEKEDHSSVPPVLNKMERDLLQDTSSSLPKIMDPGELEATTVLPVASHYGEHVLMMSPNSDRVQSKTLDLVFANAQSVPSRFTSGLMHRKAPDPALLSLSPVPQSQTSGLLHRKAPDP